MRRGRFAEWLIFTTLTLAVGAFVAASQLGVGFSLRIREITQALPGDNFVVAREGSDLFDDKALALLRTSLEDLDATVLPLVFPVEPSTQGLVYHIPSGERKVVNWPLCFMGIDPSYFEQTGLILAAGRVFSDAETRAGAPVAVIGAGHRAGSGQPEDKPVWAVGDTIEQSPYLGGRYTVIGVLSPARGSPPHEPDDTIYVPWSAYPVMLDQSPGATDSGSLAPRPRQTGCSLWVSVPDGRLDVAVDATRKTLAAFDQQGKRLIIAVESGLANVFRLVASKMSRYLWWVALILLGLGAMQVSVLTLLNMIRRSREFAILRALGAGPRVISTLASGPSVWVALSSAGAGCILGVVLASPLGVITGSPVKIESSALGLATGVLVLLSLVAASLPAQLALRQDVLTALSETRVAAFRRASGLPKLLCSVMISVGVFATAIIWGLGAATEDQVDRVLGSVGYEAIVIRPSSPFAPLPETWVSDLSLLLRECLPPKSEIGGMICSPATIRTTGEGEAPGADGLPSGGFQGWALAADEVYLHLKHFSSGAQLPRLGPGLALVGSAVASRLGLTVGDRLLVGDDLTVTLGGILDDPGSDVYDIGPYDRRGVTVLDPVDFASCRSARVAARSGEVWVSSATLSSTELSQAVEVVMPSLPSWAGQTELVDMGSALREAGVLRADFATALAVVACLGLLLGVSATAVVTTLEVTENRREVGILRSMGASAAFIRRAWLRRTLVFSLTSGLSGLVLAASIFVILARQRGWSPSPGYEMGLLALLLTTAGGLAAGWYPASLAAKVDPLDCLRGE